MPDIGPSPLTALDRDLSVAEARAAIARAVTPITQAERVPLAEALGRVLAEPIVSPIDVPAHDNSAMDGYAFDGCALPADAPLRLRCVGTLLAGKPHAGAVGPGECLRIMTGAVMPPGLDTVLPVELAQVDGVSVTVPAGSVRAGENLRRRGEDLFAGRPALPAGRPLKPADLGLLASLGLAEAPVLRRLRVAVFSTGDEIRAPGQSLEPGCIFDSNRHSLTAAVRRLGFEAIDLGLVRDDPVALQAALAAATACADVVLTSGGVSMGDADHTRDVLAQLGEVGFWKVAMRPGRPFAFGALRRAGAGPAVWLFALPGNPVAALVSFYVLARDGLLRLAGASAAPLPLLQARCTAPIRKRPGRTEYQRAIVEPSATGWQVRLTGSQGAGVLRSMSEANALVVLDHAQTSVAAGEWVDVLLFDGLT